MVQGSPSTPAPSAVPGRRERNRLARHRSFLRTAMSIVGTEGLDGLTMARLADDLDCAVGTVYTYFPSKGALVAAVQREAIEKIGASYLVIRAETDRLIGERGPGPVVAALARAVGLGRFWAAAPETFPEEAHLLQLLMTDPREVLGPDEGAANVPSALRHLDQGRAILDQAVEVGALRPGEPWARVVSWVAAVNGVAQTSRLAVYDQQLFEGRGLADQLNVDLLRGWGADEAALAEAVALVDELAARGPLAPPVADPPEGT
jgi:AcrR family transcriptional regulator